MTDAITSHFNMMDMYALAVTLENTMKQVKEMFVHLVYTVNKFSTLYNLPTNLGKENVCQAYRPPEQVSNIISPTDPQTQLETIQQRLRESFHQQSKSLS